MKRKLLAIAAVISLTAPVHSEGPQAQDVSASTAPAKPEHAAQGLKALKAAARKDPVSIAVDLTSPEPRDRGQAAAALGRLGTAAEPAVQNLIEVLTDFDDYRDEAGAHTVSVEAAQALRQIDSKVVVPAKTLGRLARAAGAPPEHQLVQGGWVSRCGAQTEALATLTALGPLAQSELPEIIRLNDKFCTEGRAMAAAQAIGPVSADQTPRVFAALTDPDPQARRSAADYIGETHPDGAAAALGRAMNDDSASVRLAAMQALEKLHPEGEGRVPLVKPFLQDSQVDIRRQALHFLLRLAPESPLTLSLLKDQLNDADASIVLESAQAIARAQPRNRALLDALVRLAEGPDANAGLEAAEMLKTSGSRDPKVTAALEPYRERERQQQIEKALLTSTQDERAANARTLRINAIRIAKGIQEEEPDHAAHVFSSSVRRVICWTAVSVDSTPAAMREVWFYDGKPVDEITLILTDVSSRVWNSHRIKPGKWRVEVYAPGSSEALASASFTVVKE